MQDATAIDFASSPKPATGGRAGVVTLAVLFVLLFSAAMFKRVDHDEQQFVASAALLARKGLLPYRDYPYFHVPYLVYAYAAVFAFCGRLLLGARTISTICGFAIVAVFYQLAGDLFQAAGRRTRLAVASAAAVLLLCNPIFIFTSGRAWNHDLPTLAMLLAFLAAVRGIRRERAGWLFAAGLLAGIAIGTRLTFVLPAAALAAGPFLHHATGRRTKLAGAYAAGMALALVPLLVSFAQAPRQFVFGNLSYPTLNTAFREVTGYRKSMTPWTKLKYIGTDILFQPGVCACVVLIGVSIVLARRRWKAATNDFRLETRLLVLLTLGALVAGVAPTPLFVPYFYTPLIFLLLLGLYCAAAAWTEPPLRGLLTKAAAVCLPVCVGLAVHPYRGVLQVWNWRAWVPVQVHESGTEVARLCGPSARVLTVMPIVPLEGGNDIFEQLATGPFALRIGPAVTEEEQANLHVLDPDNIRTAFWSQPDAAVLTGADAFEDRLLTKAVGADRLDRHDLPNHLQLWLPRRLTATADVHTHSPSR